MKNSVLLTAILITVAGCSGEMKKEKKAPTNTRRHISRPENTAERCSNRKDDDGDSLVDCDDPDCEPICPGPENTKIRCHNGFDDDGDGLIDCVDPDCARFCSKLENTEVMCANGKDDDGDGLFDCVDPDCARFCAASTCGDGTCEAGESEKNCPTDCAKKGNKKEVKK